MTEFKQVNLIDLTTEQIAAHCQNKPIRKGLTDVLLAQETIIWPRDQNNRYRRLLDLPPGTLTRLPFRSGAILLVNGHAGDLVQLKKMRNVQNGQEIGTATAAAELLGLDSGDSIPLSLRVIKTPEGGEVTYWYFPLYPEQLPSESPGTLSDVAQANKHLKGYRKTNS